MLSRRFAVNVKRALLRHVFLNDLLIITLFSGKFLNHLLSKRFVLLENSSWAWNMTLVWMWFGVIIQPILYVLVVAQG